MLTLPNVTLIAVDGKNTHFTAQSMKRSQKQAEFANVILFDKPYLKSKQEVGIFIVQEVHRYINTSHVLNVEWDSWIVHPEHWTDEFLEYDYIGAKWPWATEGNNIGNTGFWLVSKRLLELLSAMVWDTEGCMDHDISVQRPFLEGQGMKFAPTAIADRFSYERAAYPGPVTFGFHGFHNFVNHLTEAEMMELIPTMNEYIVKHQCYQELMDYYDTHGKTHMKNAMLDYRSKSPPQGA